MNITKKHIFKFILYLILAILILISAGGLFIYFKAETYINENLSKIVKNKSNQVYDLSFSNIEVTFSPLSLAISDVNLQADSIKQEEIRRNSPETIFYSFKSPKIEIIKFGLFTFLRKKIFVCDKIILNNPILKLSGEEILNNESENTFDKVFVEMRPLFLKYVREIKINSIEFENANYGFYKTGNDSINISVAEQISVKIKNFRTDSFRVFGKQNFFDSDDILVRMKNFQNDLGDSLHILSIDTLEYSLKSTDIFANGFHLKHYSIKNDRSLYDVYVPRLYMKSESISRFALNDSIHVRFLEFDRPRIKFYQKENPKRLDINDISNFDLYSLVKTNFAKIEIDSFLLTNAKLEIYKQPDMMQYQQNFESLNITLNGFLLDSLSSQNTEKIFYANDLEMTVADYHLRLEDNQHNFTSDSMFVSTFSKSLGVHGINISPTSNNSKPTRTAAYIKCKILEISDVNLKTLYHTRSLPTEKIKVVQPNVRLQYQSEIKRSEKQLESGLLFELVSAYLKGVYANDVEIENGILNIQNRNRKNVQGYFETKFHFKLADFSLDSASISKTDKFFFASNFDLEFSDYQMRLIDDLHKINVEQVSILSSDRKVNIENLHLQPVETNITDEKIRDYNRSELYNIQVPQITLWGVNLRNAFFHNKLTISDFRITNPKIYFENFAALRETKQKTEIAEIYPLIFNYLSDFNIKEINIPNGTFTWINHTKKGKTTSFDNEFSASLYNFKLNEQELKKQRLLFSDNFEISIKDQTFQLSDSVHILRAGEIDLSTKNKSVFLKNALLYPIISSTKYPGLTTTFQVTIPTLEISNFDFLKAYYSHNLQLNKLDLNRPKFKIYSKRGVKKSMDLNKYKFPMPSFIHFLSVNELKINKGEVTTYETVDSKQHAQSNFYIDLSLPSLKMSNNENKEAQITSKNLLAKISGFSTPLEKSHELKIGEMEFNRSQKTVSISNLKLIPKLGSKSGNTFAISTPQMYFSNFDINLALDHNYYIFDLIKIENPKLDITIADSIKGNKFETAKNLDLYPLVEPYVNKIEIGNLQFADVDLRFNWFKKELVNKQFNLDFKSINIGKDQKHSNLLNSQEFEFSTKDLKTISKNGMYEFTAEMLKYNSAKHNILVNNIKINPLFTREEFPRKTGFQTDFVRAGIKFIELKNIDENSWIQDNLLKAGVLLIGESDVDIYKNKRYPFNSAQRPPWPQDLLSEIKQPFLFNEIQLMPSNLKYSELMDISDEPGYIDFNALQFNSNVLSNVPEFKNSNFKLIAKTKMLGKTKLDATFIFDLKSNLHKHSVSGSLSPFELDALNVIVEKSAPFSIVSGQLNRFDFDINFNDKKAEGEMYFGFDDFKISVFEMDENELKKSKFASFWVNKMILNSKNPKGNEFLPQTISYERDVQRSIINYWWKAIFTGSKETLGIGDAGK